MAFQTKLLISSGFVVEPVSLLSSLEQEINTNVKNSALNRYLSFIFLNRFVINLTINL